jgi:hypothetical protein
MTTKRIPIGRPRKAPLPPEALDLFREMKTLRCTCRPIDWEGKYWERDECPGCERWWSLHSRLAQLLPGIRPWHWPVIQSPGAKCPYPEGSPAAAAWRPNEEAQARWRVLDAALAEAEQAKVIFATPKKPARAGMRKQSASTSGARCNEPDGP